LKNSLFFDLIATFIGLFPFIMCPLLFISSLSVLYCASLLFFTSATVNVSKWIGFLRCVFFQSLCSWCSLGLALFILSVSFFEGIISHVASNGTSVMFAFDLNTCCADFTSHFMFHSEMVLFFPW